MNLQEYVYLQTAIFGVANTIFALYVFFFSSRMNARAKHPIELVEKQRQGKENEHI